LRRGSDNRRRAFHRPKDIPGNLQQPASSEPGFLLAAHSQDRYAVIRDAIARHVTATAEVYDPVVERFVHALYGPTDLRMPGEDFDAVTDGLYRPTRGGNVLYREKAVEPLDAYCTAVCWSSFAARAIASRKPPVALPRVLIPSSNPAFPVVRPGGI